MQEAQKWCSELAQTGSLCHDVGVHVHTSLKINNANNHLKDLSSSQNASFMEDSLLASTSVLGKVYDIYGSEMLHSLHLYIPMLLKECTCKLFGSDRAVTKPSRVVVQRRPLRQMRMSLLRGVNVLLASFDHVAGVIRLNKIISNEGNSLQPKSFFIKQWGLYNAQKEGISCTGHGNLNYRGVYRPCKRVSK